MPLWSLWWKITNQLQQQPNIPALGGDSPGAGILAWAIPPQRLLQNRHTLTIFVPSKSHGCIVVSSDMGTLRDLGMLERHMSDNS